MNLSLKLSGKVHEHFQAKITELGLKDIGDAVIILRTTTGDSIVQKIDEVSVLEAHLNPSGLFIRKNENNISQKVF